MKLWPWAEANLKQIIAVAVAIVVVGFGIAFYSTHQTQAQIAAGEALTHASLESHGADTLLKINSQYPGTHAGQRAMLQAATLSFETGKYADAQAQFQKFLDAYPDNELASEASLGVAESLEAQNKTSDAVSAYQRVINQSTSLALTAAAKFALARIYAEQGKPADAEKLYQEIKRQDQNSPYAQEADMRAMELRTSAFVPTTVASTTNKPAVSTPTTPFELTH